MVIASNKGCVAVSWLGCSWRVSVLAFCGPNGWFSVCTWLKPLKGCFREYKLLLLSAVTAESWRGEMLQPAPGEALGWCWHQRASGWGRKINNVQSFCRETANTKLRNTSQRKSLPPSFGLLSGSSAFANKAGFGDQWFGCESGAWTLPHWDWAGGAGSGFGNVFFPGHPNLHFPPGEGTEVVMLVCAAGRWIVGTSLAGFGIRNYSQFVGAVCPRSFRVKLL